MALDGGMISCLAQELREVLMGARVDKIHQPSREELVLSLRGASGVKKLYLSARMQSPRATIISRAPDNPASPPMFCMLLRKRLTGGKLTAIRQDGLERVLCFDFDCVNEFGDPSPLTVACEMTGRHNNIVLIENSGRVVDAIRRVDTASSEVRPIVPGVTYVPPPPLPDKLSPLDASGGDIACAAKRRGGSLSDALFHVTQGLSPLRCREIAYQALRGADKRCEEMDEEQWERTAFFAGRVCETLRTGERKVPYLLRNLQGDPIAAAYTVITQYGLSAVGMEMPDFSSLIEAFYEEKDRAERLRQRAHDTLKVLVNVSSRIERKLQKQREELASPAQLDTYRLYGDLLVAQGNRIPPGAKSAEVVNYYDAEGGLVTIPLDPSRSAAANAQKYYREYRKARTAREVLTVQIDRGEEELRYLDSVLDALSRSHSLPEIAQVREELVQSGYIRETGTKKKKSAPALPFLRFKSSDGSPVLVGRNNMQNDRLTLKIAKGNDLWLHVKNIPGSHVIVQAGADVISEQTKKEAAVLAATYSKASLSSQVPVDATLAKYVRKPAGAKPGMVIYEHQQTWYVTPDPSLADRLRVPDE